ncbi:hypothetical protein Tcan_04152, partial [Toxocara canis]
LQANAVNDECLVPREFHAALNAYINCANQNISANRASISKEISDHTRRAVTTCFASTTDKKQHVSGQRCVMDASELDTKAWGKNGPLKDCKLCRTFASAIVTATLYTPPEEAQCFQIEIVRAVAREGSKCIAKNDPNFPGLPSVPVINKPSQEQIADLVDDISNFIIVQSRIQKCAQKDAIAANETAKCLENPFPGFLDAYNDVLRKCSTVIPAYCQKELNDLKKAVCSCVQETRAEISRRFKGLANSFNVIVATKTKQGKAIGRGSRIETCVEKIRDYMKTDVNDWYEVIDSATSKCLKSNPMRQTVGIKPLLHLGCKKILRDKTGHFEKMFSEALNFVGFLIDAITNRSSQICNAY